MTGRNHNQSEVFWIIPVFYVHWFVTERGAGFGRFW